MFIVLKVFVIAKESVSLHRFLRSCLHTCFRNEGLFGFFIERTIKSLWILRKCYCNLSFAYNHVCWQAAPYEKSIHLFERLVKLLFVISAFFRLNGFSVVSVLPFMVTIVPITQEIVQVRRGQFFDKEFLLCFKKSRHSSIWPSCKQVHVPISEGSGHQPFSSTWISLCKK